MIGLLIHEAANYANKGFESRMPGVAPYSSFASFVAIDFFDNERFVIF